MFCPVLIVSVKVLMCLRKIWWEDENVFQGNLVFHKQSDHFRRSCKLLNHMRSQFRALDIDFWKTFSPISLKLQCLFQSVFVPLQWLKCSLSAVCCPTWLEWRTDCPSFLGWLTSSTCKPSHRQDHSADLLSLFVSFKSSMIIIPVFFSFVFLVAFPGECELS